MIKQVTYQSRIAFIVDIKFADFYIKFCIEKKKKKNDCILQIFIYLFLFINFFVFPFFYVGIIAKMLHLMFITDLCSCTPS